LNSSRNGEQRKISMRSIEGPIRIGQAAGEAARRKGWTPLMGLTAAISLNLGIFNLLPIPSSMAA